MKTDTLQCSLNYVQNKFPLLCKEMVTKTFPPMVWISPLGNCSKLEFQQVIAVIVGNDTTSMLLRYHRLSQLLKQPGSLL